MCSDYSQIPSSLYKLFFLQPLSHISALFCDSLSLTWTICVTIPLVWNYLTEPSGLSSECTREDNVSLSPKFISSQ